jgi:hypothetical protein
VANSSVWEVVIDQTLHAMAQAVSHWHLIVETRVCTQVNLCGICGEQSGTGTSLALSDRRLKKMHNHKLFTKYYCCDLTKEGERDRACSMHGGENVYTIWLKNLKETTQRT